MRVLAAEDGVYLHNLLLPFQRLQIVRYPDEVDFGRQFIGRVPPVAVGENAKLTAFHKGAEAFLQVGEVAGRAFGPVADALRYLAGLFRIGLQGAHHVHPVQCVQVVKMHHVIVHIKGGIHDIAHQFSIGRHVDTQRIFHSAHRGQGVYRGANAAHTPHKRPHIARVAALHYLFNAAHHGAGAIYIGDFAVFDFCFYAQVPLYAGDRVNDDALCHVWYFLNR